MNDHQMTGGGTVPQWIYGMGVAVWISDENGKIVFINERAESVLGRDAASTVGMPCYQIVGGKDDDGQSQAQR